MKLIVKDNLVRLDKYIELNTDLSRSQIKKLIKEEHILINNQTNKPSYIVKENDEISINVPEVNTEILKEDMKLNIIFEDTDIIVINKPSGLVTHPSANKLDNTLVNGLLAYTTSLSDIGGNYRPGIVHRLDADTSGILVIAKNNVAHELLAEQFKKRTPTRIYKALVHGNFEHDTGTIDAPIGRDINNRKKLTVTGNNSKEAITEFTVVKNYEEHSLLDVKLITGRTHQIRVHMQYIKHPVVCDRVYGRLKDIKNHNMTLHAETLGFIHPTTNKYVEFKAPLPAAFKEVIKLYEENE